MLTNNVALHRLVQAINWQGSVYTFFRRGENEYREKDGEPVEIARFKGLFHNGSSEHTTVVTSDSGMVISKNTPYIMTPYGNGRKVRLDDTVIINSKMFKVTGVTNINEANIVAEISLEVVL